MDTAKKNTHDVNAGTNLGSAGVGSRPLPKREDYAIRQRNLSSGSTRGAFYQGNSKPPNAEYAAPAKSETIETQKKRSQKKKSMVIASTNSDPQSSKTHHEQPSMADLAALAMQSLDPGDIMPLPSTQPFARTHELSLNDDEVIPKVGHQRKTSKVASARLALMDRVQSSKDDTSHIVHPSEPDLNVEITSPEVREASFFFKQGAVPSLGNKDYSGILDHNRRQSEMEPLFGGQYADDIHELHEQAPSTNEINLFASLVKTAGNVSYGATTDAKARTADLDNWNKVKDKTDNDENLDCIGTVNRYIRSITRMLDPTDWLSRDVRRDDDTDAIFFERHYSMAALVRYFLYNPIQPEFTSLQQFVWACLIGVFMGFYTAFWKLFIEVGVEIFWKTIPEWLLECGVFTHIDGVFPLYHYMWIVPSLFGGFLSYIFAAMPIKIPDQNDWINSVHARGVQDYQTFFQLFFLSTCGMWSGLSLGPELPLVLTAGMVGSGLALLTKQSMLQARVLNLTAASAAIGGFFGFPMAGALFVLELPHRMGLQYFEALSPGTIASIVAVLVNRLVTGNDVTGYYSYPFLTTTLPSSIFSSAIVYGFYGCLIGTLYVHGTKTFKMLIHDLFHAPHNDSADQEDSGIDDETDDKNHIMVNKVTKTMTQPTLLGCLRAYFCVVIPNEPKRAMVAGIIAGAVVGVVGIFIPHTMFWGEAQLQNLIDKGRTPLPIFGEGNEPTAAFKHFAFCMVDATDASAIRAGFGVGCSALIAVAKTVVIGLSLGTGIIGGQFWGPLYVGCAASHLFSGLVKIFQSRFGFGGGLAAYPCVVILCTMGSAHVVTFRAHMAIMLILTLTISAFNPEESDSNNPFDVAGDYSAVFPLLVVSVFISLMASRDTVFYPTQRSRGDITAVPEVLCQPGMAGAPLVVVHDDEFVRYDDDDASFSSGSGADSDVELALPSRTVRMVNKAISQSDIENAFNKATDNDTPPLHQSSTINEGDAFERAESETPRLSSSRLDELLNAPIVEKPKHRRTKSAPFGPPDLQSARSHSRSSSKDWGAVDESEQAHSGNRSRIDSAGSQRDLVRVTSFGEIQEHQPSLMEQARLRAASAIVVIEQTITSHHRRVPSMPSYNQSTGRHRRVPSLPMGRSRSHTRSDSPSPNNTSMLQNLSSAPGALSVDDIEQSFNSVVNGKVMTKSPWSDPCQGSR